MSHSYRYTTDAGTPCKKCPACGHDWLVHGGVLIELTQGFAGSWEVGGRLDADGTLLDSSRGVAKGLHSATLCGGCREQLLDFDDVNEN